MRLDKPPFVGNSEVNPPRGFYDASQLAKVVSLVGLIAYVLEHVIRDHNVKGIVRERELGIGDLLIAIAGVDMPLINDIDGRYFPLRADAGA